MKVEFEEIKGMYSESDILCRSCMSEYNWNSLTGDVIITTQHIENANGAIYFCDMCDKKL